jgi:hypothetical protein
LVPALVAQALGPLRHTRQDRVEKLKDHSLQNFGPAWRITNGHHEHETNPSGEMNETSNVVGEALTGVVVAPAACRRGAASHRTCSTVGAIVIVMFVGIFAQAPTFELEQLPSVEDTKSNDK